MAKGQNKKHKASRPGEGTPVSYVGLGSAREMDLRFYESYDADFFYSKAAAIDFLTDAEEARRKEVESLLLEVGLPALSATFDQALRAELFFTELHQYECFFALLIALFQPLPHWIYLTRYRPGDIPRAVEQFVAGNIAALTAGQLHNDREFAAVAVYREQIASDAELASRWDENLDNVGWLIRRMGEHFLEYGLAYNSYKHGLRAMTGPTSLALAPQNLDGTLQGPMRTISASPDSVTYLKFEPEREEDGEKVIPVSEVTKHFNPAESLFFLMKMHQMTETIKATRLACLQDSAGAPLNMFFSLDRRNVISLAKRDEWTSSPASKEKARAYQQMLDAMRAHVAHQSPDAPPPPERDEAT